VRVGEAEFQTLRTVGFLAAAAVAVGLQRWAPHRRVRGSWRVNLGVWTVNLLVIGTVCGACACTVARWAAERGVGVLNAAALPWWAAVPVTVVVLDLVSYGWHRANHTFSFLWRFHQVHHSDASFTTSTAVRFHPGELLLSLPLRLAVVVALGAPVAGVVCFELLFGTANLIEHGDIAYPRWLERRLQRFLVTPALHRRHHGRGGAELGSNFGTVFSLWDRALGTYRESTSATRIDTGLAWVRTDLGLLAALRLPLASAQEPVPGRARGV
jgi:sterol desaturase/sphingolipid hydroxylase (fatty acid hydroxylase superfamily)